MVNEVIVIMVLMVLLMMMRMTMTVVTMTSCIKPGTSLTISLCSTSNITT